MKINFLFLVLLNCTTAFFTRPYIYRVSKIYLKNNELEGNEYYLELHLSNKNNTSKPGYPKQSNMNISYPPIDDIESEESLRKYKQSLFGGDQQPEKKNYGFSNSSHSYKRTIRGIHKKEDIVDLDDDDDDDDEI